MICLYYDSTFEGMLTVIFEVYNRKFSAVTIRKSGCANPSAGERYEYILTHQDKAFRVLKKMTSIFGKQGVESIWQAWLSESPGMENCILSCIQHGIKKADNILYDFANPYVLKLHQARKEVEQERRSVAIFTGLKRDENDLYYATVEPNHNVLPLLIPYFVNAYAGRRWLLYDILRNYGVVYDLHQTKFVYLRAVNGEVDNPTEILHLNLHEKLYRKLWMIFTRNAGLEVSKDVRLHLQHVQRANFLNWREKLYV